MSSVTVKQDPKNMPGPFKAAVLMLYLGESVAKEVFKRLSNDEVMRISQEISSLGSVPADTSKAVADYTHRQLVATKSLLGSVESAQKLLESAFSPEVAKNYIREIAESSEVTARGRALLQKADPRQLSKLLQVEHPQTIALVLSNVTPDLSAKTVALLDDDLRAEVCVRLACLEQISPPVRDRVIDILANKLDTRSHQMETGAKGGVRRVAEIFNNMDRDISQSCLEQIEQDNPNLALEIRNNMFVFEDLLVVGDREMRKIIQSIDKQVLVTALKGTSDELKEHFFDNMSSRAVEMLREDMDAMGPIRLKDAEQAQQEIVATVRDLEQQGQFDLGAGGAEEYVS
ncbi:MAG TPA: flagellar motor switch protein FliG [Acidobacteriota bacterium]|nr:flagellar motor switch protein FliG [Acidobacteriota bacterium]